MATKFSIGIRREVERSFAEILLERRNAPPKHPAGARPGGGGPAA